MSAGTEAQAGPGFWRVVLALLGAARQRAKGRARRQAKLMRSRGVRGFFVAWPWVAVAFVGLFAAALQIAVAYDMMRAVRIAERVQAEARGRVVVEEWFAGRIETREREAAASPLRRATISAEEANDIGIEAPRIAQRLGLEAGVVAARLRKVVSENPKALLSARSLWWQPGGLPDLMALILLLWWMAMLACQGEGIELDTQRARYPMWEWLFSHPAPPAAIFLAEMIAPVAANPVYVTAPLFPGCLFGWMYGWPLGIAAGLLVGVPMTVALACVGKAIEVRAVLRLSQRARGAVLGLMGWFGYTSMFVLLFSTGSVNEVAPVVARWLARYGDLPWPPMRLLLGRDGSGTYHFWLGLALCWLLASVLIVGAVAAGIASARRGLAGASAGTVRVAAGASARFGRHPLYRKELLWFRRDGSAIVQAFLVPLSLAAFQLFGMRDLVSKSSGAWNTLCGAAIIFGTYFLVVLGPKSLASEGQALWIAQTWPRGLEALLKAKARLWALIAGAIVGLVLAYTAWRFPGDIVPILVVAVLWWVFARSLAEKTVTLATVTSSSGETEKIPQGRRWAAMLGTFTFAIGILTRQWNLAIVGVVYSMLTAAAMWQNFRHRLPYLYDPWSETLPPAPTLLHAMVAISTMVEGVAVLSGLAFAAFGRDEIALINAGLYAFAALVAALILVTFLARRGVPQREIWLWRADGRDPSRILDLDRAGRGRVVLVIATGAALGAVLGLAALAYLWALHGWPDAAEAIDEGRRRLDELPDARLAYIAMAIGVAPFAEEFLFRGLLYRALDREWGGWRAIGGAAAFFAIYHPTVSWAPVGALGAMNALLFKRTGRLAPAVAAHMAYNAVVLLVPLALR